MKKLICIFLMTFAGITAAFSQTVTLTFTGRDADNHFIPFDRVEIGNVTRSWQETIYYPDSIIVMGGTGIEENVFTKVFVLAQNNPNPFEVTTNATLTTSENGEVTMEMLDMNGRMVASQKCAAIQAGSHQFVLTVAAPGTYILTVRQNGKTSSIKMVNKGEGAINKIEYVGLSGTKAEMTQQKNGSKGIITSPFNLGDDMVYIGYVNINGVEYTSQTIHKNQIVSENFVLNFNAAAPAGLATVTTDEVTDIQPTSATCGGNVVNDGGYSVIARGICWSTTPTPVFNDNHISNGDGLGAFTCQLTNLSENTTYYLRAYAVNSVGTAYGQQRSFTTVTLPTVTTNNVSNITATTATCGGRVTDMGGAPVTSRGVCWSTSQNPTVNDSHTTDGSGMGDFTSNMTGLIFGTTYYVRAYATNSGGTAYGEQRYFTANIDGQPCPGTPMVTDYDGNVYNTVQIGNQCWMKENLRTTHYSNSTSIPNGGSSSSAVYPYYYDYSSSSIPLSQRGLLYNWPAVMHGANSSSSNPSGVQGICPTGWHVPSDAEWTQLTGYVRNQSGYLCDDTFFRYIAKSLSSTTGWNTSTITCAVGNNQSANNTTGFSAVPAGIRWYNSFINAGNRAYIWSATHNNSSAFGPILQYDEADVSSGGLDDVSGCSVRCLRDASGGGSTTTLPIVLTNTVSSITANTATCGGSVTNMGGAPVTSRGVCWSTSQNPTVSDSHTTDGSGMGDFISNMTGLIFGTTYYVRAYATNSGGTAYGEQRCFTPNNDVQPCPGTPTVTDYDGNVYNTVQIGNQCWMKENLRTTHYSNAASILNGGSSSSDTYPYYYVYSSSSIPLSQRGLLYNWPAVMHGANSSSSNPSGVQGICPTGWHVPSDAEWKQLRDYVSSQCQYVCGTYTTIAKALSSTTGWNTSTSTCTVGNNQSANNTTGFSAVPAGCFFGSSFYSEGTVANFWSTYQGDGAFSYSLVYNDEVMLDCNFPMRYGYSVRCLKN